MTAIANAATVDYQMFVGGRWVDASGGERLPSHNPYDQSVWATIPQAGEPDVKDAIAAARTAFETWRTVPGVKRMALMFELARLLDEEAERMGLLETTDNGKVIRETKSQMHFAARNYRFFGGLADKLYGETIPMDNGSIFDYTIREPIGVAALITAWNSPMQILANKLAPALAAGCTVVIKPSEHASATTVEFAKLVEKAGFPPGVVNVITGDYRVGTALTSLPGVDKISFTGGAATARILSRNASEHLIPLTLELGGKSPNIIFEDADLSRAIVGALAGIFAASGQTCIAGSRLLVQRSIYQRVADELAQRARQIRLGDPRLPETEMGPAANEAQLNRIKDFLQKGKAEGARLIAGGDVAKGQGLERGFFVEPTIFADVDPDMTIAQQEIFGPILSMIPFDDEDQAIAIANSTNYGLAAGVWTQSMARAVRVPPKLGAGVVWVNTYRVGAAQAPFGGTKQSGYGRERGMHAVHEFLQVKNVMIDISSEARDPFILKT